MYCEDLAGVSILQTYFFQIECVIHHKCDNSLKPRATVTYGDLNMPWCGVLYSPGYKVVIAPPTSLTDQHSA